MTNSDLKLMDAAFISDFISSCIEGESTNSDDGAKIIDTDRTVSLTTLAYNLLNISHHEFITKEHLTFLFMLMYERYAVDGTPKNATALMHTIPDFLTQDAIDLLSDMDYSFGSIIPQ